MHLHHHHPALSAHTTGRGRQRAKCHAKANVRKQKSRVKTQIHHCSRCNQPGHRKGGNCPLKRKEKTNNLKGKRGVMPAWAPLYEEVAPPPLPRLRNLKHEDFETVCKWTEKQCKAKLLELGFLPPGGLHQAAAQVLNR